MAAVITLERVVFVRPLIAGCALSRLSVPCVHVARKQRRCKAVPVLEITRWERRPGIIGGSVHRRAALGLKQHWRERREQAVDGARHGADDTARPSRAFSAIQGRAAGAGCRSPTLKASRIPCVLVFLHARIAGRAGCERTESDACRRNSTCVSKLSARRSAYPIRVRPGGGRLPAWPVFKSPDMPSVLGEITDCPAADASLTATQK
jgi:hypothetical protein